MWALAAPYLSNGHLPAWLSCSSPFRAINRLALCGVREPHPEQYSSTVYRWWTRTFHGTWAASATKITSKVKAKAVADVFKPASAIVKDILLEDLDDIPCPSLPRPEIIRRAANRRHQRLRPKDPQDLEFELATDHIPSEFLRADLRVRIRRHLVFATDQQFEFLARAKSWYINTTFKLCRRPFSQLDGECLHQKGWPHKTSPTPVHVDVRTQKVRLLQGLQGTNWNPAISPKSAADHTGLRKSNLGSPEKSSPTHQSPWMCVSLDASPLEKGKINLI